MQVLLSVLEIAVIDILVRDKEAFTAVVVSNKKIPV